VLADALGPPGAILGPLSLLFQHVNPKPPPNNGTQILQWSFFGDMNTNGNEACQKGSATTPPSPNCVVVYDASYLAGALGLNNYDATVLSVWANDGYAISIPDLAAKVCVMDDTGSLAQAVLSF